MRVIAGKLGGRTFRSPDGHRTHPMSDKIRGAIFNLLGDIEGLSVLDAFAGSGALSIEAVSRSASQVTAIDVDKRAYETISENIKSLDISDKIKVTRANISTWSDLNPDKHFDIVLLDPPYDSINHTLLEKLVRHAKPNGIIVISRPPKTELSLTAVKILSSKSYGDAQIDILRKS